MIDPRNYIPGCVSYTKASEISSLQKYLKKGIKKRDEELKLPENPEELKKDPLIPEVSELPKGSVGLHGLHEVTELPDKSLRIVDPREEALETHRENIIPAETPGLPDTAVGLEDNREAALEDHREDISVPEADSLVDYREDITDEHEITELPGTRLDINDTLALELPGTRLDINESITPELPGEALKTPGEIKEPESLEDTRLDLEGDLRQPGVLETTKLETPGSETPHEVIELPGTIIEGPKASNVSLEDYRENIESNEDPGSLENYREDISDKRSISLGDHKESIEDRRKATLENYREDLEDRRGIALEDYREDISDKHNPKLETHKDTLEDDRNVNLENHKDLLEDRRDPSLETHREELSDKRSPKLETRKDVIDDKRSIDLDDTQLKTPGKQKTPELSGTIISGPEVKEVGLEKSKISLEDRRGITLEDYREDITDKKSPELPGTIIGLSDKRDISLETGRETIKDSQNPELSETREDIKVPGTPDLPMTSVRLEAGSEDTLEDYQEKLTGVQDISGLPVESDDIPGKTNDPKLETTKITRPGTDTDVVLPKDRLNIANPQEVTLPDGSLPIEGEVSETESLEDTKLLKPGETPDPDQIYSDTTGEELYPLEGSDVTLPDTRLDIANPNEPSLQDEKLPMEPGMSDPGWSGELSDTVIHDGGNKNLIGWDGKLVTVKDIKAEPENNWTIEPDLNPEKPGESTDINVILGLETEAIKITPHKTEAPMDPDHAQKFVDTTYNHSFKKGIDGVSSSINSEFSEETVIGLKEYGEETKDPKKMDPSQPNLSTPNPWETGTDLNYIDTGKEEDLKQYGEETDSPVKISPYIPGTSIDPDHSQEFVDTTYNHSFKENSDGVSSSIESEFSSGTIIGLEEYGEKTKDPRTRPDHVDPEHTDNPRWEHIDTTSMNQEDFNLYNKNKKVKITGHVLEEPADPDHRQRQNPIDLSQNHNFMENSDGTSSSVESEFYGTTELEKYGKETEKPIKMERPLDENILTADPDHRHNFIDVSRNHSFSKKSDGVSSSIESEFSNTSDLEECGKETEKPETRPEHKDPEHTDNPKWEHIDIHEKTQKEFNEYIKNRIIMDASKDWIPMDPDHAGKFVDISRNHSFSKKSDGVSSSIESEFSNTSGLEEYGKETEKPVEITPSQGIPLSSKEKPEAEEDALKGPFHWSEDNMGRSGWHVDDLAIPAYKLGGSFTSFLNPSKYLRWVVENTVGAISFGKRGGSVKQWILDEALAGLIAARDKLEKSLNLQPWRLPGSNNYTTQLLRQGMSGVDLGDAKNFVGNAAANLLSSAAIIKNPINRPGKEDKTKGGQEYRWEGMTKFQSKDGQNISDLYADTGKNVNDKNSVITKALGSNQGLLDYFPSYLKDTDVINIYSTSKNFGMLGTLNNLTNWETTKIESFDELKAALENSPYATTSSSVYGLRSGSIHRHDVSRTLDSNHVWEIIFEPYLGPENGNKSFLPSIQQINYENFYGFGINTNWDTWIPFTSFELNSKKMVQKNLSLYSGEISIPQNLEFTNELRLVICDDQYKSWKRYFDSVMYASTYLCEVHDKDYYTKKILKNIGGHQDTFNSAHIADYYKGVIRPAPYKNLTFRCKILSMNPQFQTVNLSDLLVVLKDFTEEWQGEVDASPTELALMFSVVGENPSAELNLSEGAKKNQEEFSKNRKKALENQNQEKKKEKWVEKTPLGKLIKNNKDLFREIIKI